MSTLFVGIVVTGTLNWAGFERRSLKAFKQSRLRLMFYYAKIAWSLLLQASIRSVQKHYEITRAMLVIDDTDKQRAKRKPRKSSLWIRQQI